MNGLARVVGRIGSIEQRFMPHINQPQNHTFSDVLSGVQQQNSAPALNTSQMNIAKMVEFSARQHGLDPKLAVAVASVESGLAPDVVSSAGAVGVMQLMPETAQALGVRNINDPRENVDAGVRYLKQMLDSFNGDVPKAIAAYNAGPQAVKNYGGVPPYSETKAYVAKVISLYKQ